MYKDSECRKDKTIKNIRDAHRKVAESDGNLTISKREACKQGPRRNKYTLGNFRLLSFHFFFRFGVSSGGNNCTSAEGWPCLRKIASVLLLG